MPITNAGKIKKAVNDLINFIKETKGDEAAEKAQEAEHLVALGVLRKLAIEGKMKAIELVGIDTKYACVFLFLLTSSYLFYS